MAAALTHRSWDSLPSRTRTAITAQVLATYGNACHLQLPGCTGIATEPDHLHPNRDGGPHTVENMRPACRHCNAARGARPLWLPPTATSPFLSGPTTPTSPVVGVPPSVVEVEDSPGSADSCWDGAPWLGELRVVPEDARWPRFMTGLHPRAVGSLGGEFVGWSQARRGRSLRWWQKLTAFRLLEVDAAGRLVWGKHLATTARQVGKSTIFRELALWRIGQGERFGEEQLVLLTGKDLPSCKEIQRPARLWARHAAQVEAGFVVRETNGQEEIVAPDGSRWMIRGKDSVYSYTVSVGMVDEAWKVPASAVDDGMEPTMAEREQPQLWVTSTAHRKATSLFRSRRALALAELAEPDDTLLLEWSAPAGAAIEDEEAWRAASPHWSPGRERLVRGVLRRALAGEGDPTDDDDPVEAFRSQWLNVWTPGAPVRVGRDEPLVDAAVWAAAGDLEALPPTGDLVVAVEDWFGTGAAAAAAGWDEHGRVMVWGQLFESRTAAFGWAARWLAGCATPTLLVGASIAADAAVDPVAQVATPEPAGGTQSRAALPALRELLTQRLLVHDGGVELVGQVRDALVVPGLTGLAMSPRSGRSDLLRCVAWSAQRVSTAAATVPFKIW